jgi:aspartate 1-decarboxylase
MRWFLRSKIHNATVTESREDYEGSITVDGALAEKVGFQDGEKVLVVDANNGERLETYIILGKKNSGTIRINGAAAKKIKKGHKMGIFGFELSNRKVEARKILVDARNRFVRFI